MTAVSMAFILGGSVVRIGIAEKVALVVALLVRISCFYMLLSLFLQI